MIFEVANVLTVMSVELASILCVLWVVSLVCRTYPRRESEIVGSVGDHMWSLFGIAILAGIFSGVPCMADWLFNGGGNWLHRLLIDAGNWLEISAVFVPAPLIGAGVYVLMMETPRARVLLAVSELRSKTEIIEHGNQWIPDAQKTKADVVNAAESYKIFKELAHGMVETAWSLYDSRQYDMCSKVCRRLSDLVSKVAPAVIGAALAESAIGTAASCRDEDPIILMGLTQSSMQITGKLEDVFQLGLCEGQPEVIEQRQEAVGKEAVAVATTGCKIFQARFRPQVLRHDHPCDTRPDELTLAR